MIDLWSLVHDFLFVFPRKLSSFEMVYGSLFPSNLKAVFLFSPFNFFRLNFYDFFITPRFFPFNLNIDVKNNLLHLSKIGIAF